MQARTQVDMPTVNDLRIVAVTDVTYDVMVDLTVTAELNKLILCCRLFIGGLNG